MTRRKRSQKKDESPLGVFHIENLFGYKKVKIPLTQNALILIAENGSGKTTILNALYYLLSCNFKKLADIDFEAITIEFRSGEKVELKQKELASFGRLKYHDLLALMRRYLPSREYDLIRMEVRRMRDPILVRNRLISLSTKYRIPIPYEPFELENEANLEEEIQKAKETIERNIQDSLLYFPTYRRIEEDLKNLGYEEDKFDQVSLDDSSGKLSQFGMDDVVAKFRDIKNSIIDSTFSLFSAMSGEILSQFLEDIEVTQEMRDKIQPETLNIVLSRVGEKNISRKDRKRIEELVNSRDINNSQYDQLVYFLAKLVNLYEKQKERDESIKKFAQVCNRYLNKKEIIYDEANVDISIVQTRNKQSIEIKNLSSGEKQIISLFSKIYLESKSFILLFDEPELSLSIEWQKLLLPDILASNRCNLLLAVTHSPFIFDNELDLSAKDLDMYVQES